MLSCRLLPYALADGPHNMAADEVLLESAVRGIASLRFYGWSVPTLSLGYFQPERLRKTDNRLAELPFVRRPSGGDALVHDREITYALALPSGPPWQDHGPWPRRMHQIVAAALNDLGVSVQLHEPINPEPFTGILCFHHITAGDLTFKAGKIVGSAQRRQRGAMLQHGAILLGRSPYAPSLPGIEELSGQRLTTNDLQKAIENRFIKATSWMLQSDRWSADELERIELLVINKYGNDLWNFKR